MNIVIGLLLFIAAIWLVGRWANSRKDGRTHRAVQANYEPCPLCADGQHDKCWDDMSIDGVYVNCICDICGRRE